MEGETYIKGAVHWCVPPISLPPWDTDIIRMAFPILSIAKKKREREGPHHYQKKQKQTNKTKWSNMSVTQITRAKRAEGEA
jgi:hypothetical protein